MRNKGWLSIILTLCLCLGAAPQAQAAVDVAEGVSVNKVGQYNEVALVYGDGSHGGIAIGVNYELKERTVIVNEKPEGSKVEVYFAAGGLSEFAGTGQMKLMAYSDKPGPVQASIMLRFVDPQTNDVKFVTGTVDMMFRDEADGPAGVSRSIMLTPGVTSMICDGQIYPLDEPPLIDQGRLYVPLRAIGEAFGLAVVYNEDTGYIRLTQDASEIRLLVDSTEVLLPDGSTLQMDVPVKLSSGRALLPVRYIADILGYDVAVTENDGQIPLQVMITR